MNSLIIIAHPNKKSSSHSLAYTYAEEKKKSGQDVRTIDLYEPERKQDYLQMNETNRQITQDNVASHQENITRADEICFFFPLWWFEGPAILKNWFDNNYTHGFAFKYKKGSAIPEKLLTGKSVRTFVTCGGPWWLYKTIGWIAITLPWYLGRIDYVGMKLRSWTWFTDMNKYRTHESRQWMRDKVREMAEK